MIPPALLRCASFRTYTCSRLRESYRRTTRLSPGKSRYLRNEVALHLFGLGCQL
jgi:hypothetical protein